MEFEIHLPAVCGYRHAFNVRARTMGELVTGVSDKLRATGDSVEGYIRARSALSQTLIAYDGTEPSIKRFHGGMALA
ncbi:MAG: hypothetical protein WDO24_05725 [Pseudomonadota bacterium]